MNHLKDVYTPTRPRSTKKKVRKVSSQSSFPRLSQTSLYEDMPKPASTIATSITQLKHAVASTLQQYQPQTRHALQTAEPAWNLRSYLDRTIDDTVSTAAKLKPPRSSERVARRSRKSSALNCSSPKSPKQVSVV